ncbi:hypothetical protein Lal_00014669 [Lupinus albus]|uniref:Putative transcription factor Hap3/NF-YB family n=1 Tax=Lupinus albus TaxID=3870 RepID=A0A6A4P1Q4_LUPAL|nr:putative transcription factor Hap3/NF-YB family [Lupinus albus]KAF1863210.1 hypothetical protein Lal_00014669 [Lupinus albus]
MASPNYGTREHDQYMPIANVTRIMRRILPSHAKISDEAKETVQQSVSEFISFVTAEANDRCQSEQRKTVTAEDLLFAMQKLGFDDYVEPLSLYLQRYRESEAEPFAGTRVFNYGSHSLPPPPLQPLAAGVSYGSHSLPPPPQPQPMSGGVPYGSHSLPPPPQPQPLAGGVSYGSLSLPPPPPPQQLAGGMSYGSNSAPPPPQPLPGGVSYGSHSLPPPPPQPLAGGVSYGSNSVPPPPQPLDGGVSYGSHSLPPPPPQPLAGGVSYGSGFTPPGHGMYDPSGSASASSMFDRDDGSGSGNYSIAGFDNIKRM